MNDFLPGLEHEARAPELSQWFTDPKTAQRIAVFAMQPFAFGCTTNVLEPSCGDGALIRALRPFALHSLTGVDIDAKKVERCAAAHWPWPSLFVCSDFLKWSPSAERYFELAVMNPPFEDGQTERHILHALQFCTRVVCHCPLTTLAGQDRRRGLWSMVELHRLAICSSRPKYGGNGGGMTDMCTIDVERAHRPRGDNPVHHVQIEFWS